MTQKLRNDPKDEAQDILDLLRYSLDLNRADHVLLPIEDFDSKKSLRTIYKLLDATLDFEINGQDAAMLPAGFEKITNILAKHGVSLSLLGSVNLKGAIAQVEAQSNPHHWDEKHKSLVTPLTQDEIDTINTADYFGYRTENGGYDIEGSVKKGEIFDEYHPGAIVAALLEHNQGDLNQKITLRLVDRYGEPSRKQREASLGQILKGEYSQVTYPRLGHKLPTSLGRLSDAYQTLGAIIDYTPPSAWDDRSSHPDEDNFRRKHLVSFNQIMQKTAEYLFSMTGKESIDYSDHTVAHWPELLIKYYAKTENPQKLNEVKDLFLKRDLKQTFGGTDTLRLSVVSHHAQNLGALLSCDQIQWSAEDGQIVRQWLQKLTAYLKITDLPADDSEVSHLLKGLRDIEKAGGKIGLSRPDPEQK